MIEKCFQDCLEEGDNVGHHILTKPGHNAATRFVAAAAFSVEAAKGIFLRSVINRSTDLHAAHAALRLTSADFPPCFNSISRNTRHGYRSQEGGGAPRRSPLIFISASRRSQAALETACMTKSNVHSERCEEY